MAEVAISSFTAAVTGGWGLSQGWRGNWTFATTGSSFSDLEVEGTVQGNADAQCITIAISDEQPAWHFICLAMQFLRLPKSRKFILELGLLCCRFQNIGSRCRIPAGRLLIHRKAMRIATVKLLLD